MFEQTNEVNAGGKKFQVQTHFIESPAKILSAVYSNSVLLYEKYFGVENLNPEQIREKMYILHRETISDIELLFFMADKVRSIHHPVSNNKLGVVFLKRNLIDEAIEQFKFALERDGKMVEALINLGIAYLLQKNYPLALETLQKGKALNVEYADLYNYTGLVNLELNKLDAALLDFERALKINPDYPAAHFNMAQLYLK
ncbi:tetratricopeptide repeat protein, partial [candidate division KSB1 bacterium]|nr:tetratricopeptide repeat protein [candidate division KSB1 bacterium]